MNRPDIYENALINNMVTTEDGEYFNILEWIDQKININKEFVVDIVYMKKLLGPEFRKENYDTISDSLRYVLEKYNIALRKEHHLDGVKLRMRSLSERSFARYNRKNR